MIEIKNDTSKEAIIVKNDVEEIETTYNRITSSKIVGKWIGYETFIIYNLLKLYDYLNLNSISEEIYKEWEAKHSELHKEFDLKLKFDFKKSKL
jgi:hypothetical protein